MKKNFVIIGSAAIALLIIGCNKVKMDSFVGEYSCKIHHVSTTPDTVLADTVYTGTLTITVNDSLAIITDSPAIQTQYVSAHELASGYVEWINPNGTWGLSYTKIEGDSLNARIYTHNKFGQVEYHDYWGVK